MFGWIKTRAPAILRPWVQIPLTLSTFSQFRYIDEIETAIVIGMRKRRK